MTKAVIRRFWQVYFLALIPLCGCLIMWLLHDGGLMLLHRAFAIAPRRDLAYGIAAMASGWVSAATTFLTTLICFAIGRRAAIIALFASLLFLGAFILPDFHHRRLLALWVCMAVGSILAFLLSRKVCTTYLKRRA